MLRNKKPRLSRINGAIFLRLETRDANFALPLFAAAGHCSTRFYR